MVPFRLIGRLFAVVVGRQLATVIVRAALLHVVVYSMVQPVPVVVQRVALAPDVVKPAMRRPFKQDYFWVADGVVVRHL